jgi:hypothetical protein
MAAESLSRAFGNIEDNASSGRNKSFPQVPRKLVSACIHGK